jgi:hypothetical protein
MLCLVVRRGFEAISAIREDCDSATSQTFRLSFHASPALSQAARVSGWLEAMAPVIGSEASCCVGSQSQTCPLSFHASPAFSQAARVSG